MDPSAAKVVSQRERRMKRFGLRRMERGTGSTDGTPRQQQPSSENMGDCQMEDEVSNDIANKASR